MLFCLFISLANKMRFNIWVTLAAVITVANAASTASHTTAKTTSHAPTTTSIHTSTTKKCTTSTSSPASRPTHFQVIARNSGTKWDGRLLIGSQGLNNITFDSVPAADNPCTDFYLHGVNQNVTLGNDGDVLQASYNCQQTMCPGPDGGATWLTFGQTYLWIYGYKNFLCTAVPKPGGIFHLACSVVAYDKKVTYRKAILNKKTGIPLLIPAGIPAPDGYVFFEMEIKNLD